MPKELQVKLLNLDSDEYAIRFNVGPYVDSFAEVYEREDGAIVFDSEVYTEYDLSDVAKSDVEVFKRVENWKDL